MAESSLRGQTPPLRAQWRTSAMQPEGENFKASRCYGNSAEVRIWIEPYRNVSLSLFQGSLQIRSLRLQFHSGILLSKGAKMSTLSNQKGKSDDHGNKVYPSIIALVGGGWDIDDRGSLGWSIQSDPASKKLELMRSQGKQR